MKNMFTGNAEKTGYLMHFKPKTRKYAHNAVAILLTMVLAVWQTPAAAFAAPTSDDARADVATLQTQATDDADKETVVKTAEAKDEAASDPVEEPEPEASAEPAQPEEPAAVEETPATQEVEVATTAEEEQAEAVVSEDAADEAVAATDGEALTVPLKSRQKVPAANGVPDAEANDEEAEEEEEPVQNQGLTVLVNAKDLANVPGSNVGANGEGSVPTAKTGDTVYFEIESALSDANTRSSVGIDIKVIPSADCGDLSFDKFTKQDKDGNDVIGYYVVNKGGKSVRLDLKEKKGNDGSVYYVIAYTLNQGETIDVLLSYHTATGTVPNGSSVKFEVETNTKGEDIEKEIKLNGKESDLTIYNTAELGWSKVSKSADIDSIKVIDGKVQNDIVYTLHSESLVAGKGVKYAELQQLADTFNFPEGFSLVSGEGEWSYSDGAATYSVDGSPVLTFAPSNYELADVNSDSTKVEVSDNGFVFTRMTEDKSKEMDPLDLVVTLHKEGIAVEGDVLDSWPKNGTVEISNSASLVVSPNKDNPNAFGKVESESEPVKVEVKKPEYSIELKKEVSDDLILVSDLPENEAAFQYTITATNKTNSAVSDVTVTDVLPAELSPTGTITVSDGSTAKIDGNIISWNGTLAANGKISFTIPVAVTADTVAEMDLASKLVVNNTAVVSTPVIPGIEASVPVTLWNPKDISPAVVTKTPVLLGNASGNIGVYDLSYEGGNDKYLDVSADNVMYYMVTLYNPNDSQQTYKLTDNRGNGGYYGSGNFYFTTAPTNVQGLFNGTKTVVPTNSEFRQNNYWYGYVDPDGKNGRNYSVGLMGGSGTTGDAYTLLSAGNDTNVNATITVNPKSYTYVFIPFKVKSGIYGETGVKSTGQNLGGVAGNSEIKTIPANTVTTTNTDQEAPDGPENPTKTTSAETPVGKITPSVELVKALVSPLTGYGPVTTQTESHSDGDYVYYKVTINNKTTASNGSIISVPFQFLDVLPPYLKVDVDSYASAGPSTIYGNESFFSQLSGGEPIAVVASNGNPPNNQYGGGAEAVTKAKGDAFYLQCAAMQGTLNASVFTYRTKVEGKLNDAVYVMLDGLPTNSVKDQEVSFYIRCKVVEYDKDRNWDLTKDTQSSNYGQVDGSTTGEAQSTNSVYIPTVQGPVGTDDRLLVKTERFKKYVINPDYHDAVMNQLRGDGLTLPTLFKWEQNGYLLDSLNVLPGQELDYLLVYTMNSNRYKKKVYALIDNLPSIKDSTGATQQWAYNSTGNLNPGEYVVRDIKGNAISIGAGANNGTEDNPSIGKVNSADSDAVGIGYPVADMLLSDSVTENTLAVNIVSLKLPDDIFNMTFENTLSYASSGVAPADSTVKHAIPGVSKEASNTAVNNFANQTTYTISATNFSNIRAQAVSIVDDLSPVRDCFTVDDILLAAFEPKDANGSAIAYHVVLTDTDGASYMVPYTAISEGASFADTMSAAGIDLSASDITKVEWNLWPMGGSGADTVVASINGSKSASVTVSLKDDVAVATSISNTATIRYSTSDSSYSISDSAEVKVTDSPGLTKTMKVNGEDVTQDDDNSPLMPGDEVQFTITFTNTSGVSIPYKNIKIHDTLAAGLQQNCVVMARATPVVTIANKGLLTFVDGETDITFTGNSSLSKNKSITVTYSVKVADGGGTIKNTATAGTLVATTPTLQTMEYAILDARLQKGVESIAGSAEQLHVYDMNADDNTITYNAVVHNGSTSTVNLPVSFLYDQLPEGFSFVSMSNNSASESYSAPSGWTANSGSAQAHAGAYTVSGAGDGGTIKFDVSQGGNPVELAPGEYITFSYICAIDQDARYNAYSARAEGDDFASLNSLYLAVDVDNETASRLVLKTTDESFTDNSGATETDKNYGDCAVVDKDAGGSLDKVYSGSADGWLQSDVSVTAASLLNPDVDKETALHRTVSEDASVTPKGFDVYNGTKVFNAEETSAIKWEISIDNTQGQKDIHNYSIAETMPRGFSFITDGCALYSVDELDASGKATGYVYNDVVFTLYDVAGKVQDSKVVPVEENMFDLSAEEFDIPCGYKAVVSYWGYYTGAGALDGLFANTATVKFSEKVDGTKRTEPGQNDSDDSITVSDTFESIAGYATDSVKQIILDGNQVKVDPEGDDAGAGYVKGDYADGGDDTGNGYGDGKANGYGDRTDNYVVAATNGDKVGYTLNIRNDSSVDVDEMVIIDKLPYAKDNGTNNQDSLRGSQFTVAYDTDSKMVVEVTDGLNGDTVSTLAEGSYVVLFSDKTGYSASEWNGADVSDDAFESLKSDGSIGKWHVGYKDGDVSFRVLLRDGFTLSPGQYVRVYFKGVIAADAEPGKIAWNSFGYRYKPVTRDTYILAAEPAKVGVIISTDEAAAYIALNKVDEAQEPVEGAEFKVYDNAECTGDAVGSITTTEDGTGISTPIAIDRSKSASNTFYVKEEPLVGHKTNETVYEVQLKAEDKVYKLVAKDLFDSLIGSTEICAYDDAELNDKVKRNAGTIRNDSIVVKVAKVDDDGNALPGASLELKRTDATEVTLDDVEVSGAASQTLAEDKASYSFTTANNEVVFTKLPAGAYSLTELRPPVGYEKAESIAFTVDESGVVKISGEEVPNATVTMADQLSTVDVSGQKIWDDADDQDGVRPDSITVKLMKQTGIDENGEQVLAEVDSLEVSADKNGDWKWNFESLPEYDGESKIVYSVQEVVPDGYTATAEEDGYDITNSYSTETTSASVQKIWQDDNNHNNTRPDSLVVTLQADGDDYHGASGEVVKRELNDSNNWQASVDGLPKYRDHGTEIKYAWAENEITADYAATGSETKNGWTKLTNTLQTSSLQLEKTVEATVPDALLDGQKFQFTVSILNSNDTVYSGFSGTYGAATFTDGVASVELADGETIVITDLPIGTKYQVKETTVAGFTTTATGDEGVIERGKTAHASFTNTQKLTSVSVTKEWVDNDDQDNIRPDELTVTLYAGEDVYGSYTLTEDDVDENGKWAHTFENLPLYQAGKLITYTVDEESAPSDYSKSIVEDDDTFAITNTHEVYKTQAVVVKDWQDDNDRDRLRPDKLTVTLKANGEDAYDVDGNKIGSVVLSSTNNWTYTQSNLPKNKDGEPISYSWEEDATQIAGDYEALKPETITDEEGVATTTLVNKHDVAETEVSVVKVWDDDNDRDRKRPDKLTVTLKANGKDAYDVDGILVAPVELTEAADWSATVDHLPLNASGVPIEYTWEEDSNSLDDLGYQLNQEKSAVEGAVTTLVNTYAPEQTSATVTKVWDDDEDWDGVRPDSIVVQLMADNAVAKGFDGKDIAPTVLDADDNWTATISGLPKYDAGELIAYSWSEVTELGDDYQLTSNETTGVNTVITNTHEVVKTEASVEKVWIDANNADGMRPVSLAVTLTGTVASEDEPVYQKTVALNAENSWKTTVQDLPVTKAGEEVAYAWAEQDVAGYVAADQSVTEAATVLTNALATEASVEKNWVVPQDVEAPASLDVSLKVAQDDEASAVAVDVNGRQIPTVVLNAEGNWTATVSDLPKYDADGNQIAYIWEEGDMPDGYNLMASNVEGVKTTLTNALAITSLEFKKFYYGAASAPVFNFTLTAVDENRTPLTGDDALVLTSSNGSYSNSDGSAVVKFEGITFAGVGTYWFLATEDAADDDSVITDEAQYLVKVVVDEETGLAGEPEYYLVYPDDEGEMLQASEPDDDPAFYNNDNESVFEMGFSSMSNTVYENGASVVSVYPEVKKYLNGSTDMLAGGDFTFRLLDADGNLVAEQVNDATGNVAFFEQDGMGLVFDEPGTYTYTIEEVTSGVSSDIECDTSAITYTVVIAASDTADDTEATTLTATATYTKDGQDVTDAPAFYNTQEGMNLEVYKVSRSGGEGLADCTYALWMASDAGDVMLQEATSDSTGLIVFQDVVLSQAHKYYFKEVEAPDGHTVDPYRTAYFSLNSTGDGTVLVEDTAADGWHSKYDK